MRPKRQTTPHQRTQSWPICVWSIPAANKRDRRAESRFARGIGSRLLTSADLRQCARTRRYLYRWLGRLRCSRRAHFVGILLRRGHVICSMSPTQARDKPPCRCCFSNLVAPALTPFSYMYTTQTSWSDPAYTGRLEITAVRRGLLVSCGAAGDGADLGDLRMAAP